MLLKKSRLQKAHGRESSSQGKRHLRETSPENTVSWGAQGLVAPASRGKPAPLRPRVLGKWCACPGLALALGKGGRKSRRGEDVQSLAGAGAGAGAGRRKPGRVEGPEPPGQPGTGKSEGHAPEHCPRFWRCVCFSFPETKNLRAPPSSSRRKVPSASFPREGRPPDSPRLSFLRRADPLPRTVQKTPERMK